MAWVRGESQTYHWAFNIGSAADDHGRSIACDSIGNTYVTGDFEGTADFDPSAGVANLTSNGLMDIFVAKYDSAGAYQWAFNMGGSMNNGIGIAIDGSGNVYVTGAFSGTADFDPSAGVANLTSNGLMDIFVAKYNSTGAYQWAFFIGSTSNDYGGTGIATDGSGNVYVTGAFSATADFDPSAGVADLTSSGLYDIFVVKYNSAGVYQWAFNMGGGSDYGQSIATDGSGNVYVTGFFAGTADFDPSVGVVNLTSNGSFDIFVAKYDFAGTYQWVLNVGSANGDGGYGIATDSSGNVYVTGHFQDTADFDPFGAGANLTSNGSSDIFVAKYNSAGAYQWAFNIGSASGDDGRSIATDGNGNVYVTGFFAGTADFDPSAGMINLTSNAGSEDIFVTKYNSAGSYQWAFKAGSATDDYGYGIVPDGSGNVYVTGYFQGIADFNPFAGVANLASNGGASDIFVAKYGQTSTGIFTNETSVIINLFPNPFSTQTNLQTEISLKNATLTVDNCFGQTVAQIKNINGQTIIFNRHNLASGLYFIHLTQDNQVVVTEKIIISD